MKEDRDLRNQKLDKWRMIIIIVGFILICVSIPFVIRWEDRQAEPIEQYESTWRGYYDTINIAICKPDILRLSNQLIDSAIYYYNKSGACNNQALSDKYWEKGRAFADQHNTLVISYTSALSDILGETKK